MVVIPEKDYLAHYGILRKSGRYPWGSGANPRQRARDFQGTLQKMREAGLSDSDIAKAFSTEEHPYTTRHLRQTNTIARNAEKAADIAFAKSLSDKGVSNVEIGRRFDPPKNESSVRSILMQANRVGEDQLTGTANMLRDEVEKGGFIDVSKGVATTRGISNEKLSSAVAILKDEGYEEIKVQIPQAGTQNLTTVLTLCPPGTTYRDVKNNLQNIRQIDSFSDDGGRTFFGMLPPKSLSSKRVGIIYGDEGGAEHDGVMYIRPGKADISLGGNRYAQVRVLVDGTHYLKGMAMYKNDLPEGVDIAFNTNKKKSDIGSNKLDAMKKITDDPDNPFGAIVDQIGDRDAHGNITKLTSVMNIVNKEGDWEGWKNSIASQVLSKQSPTLAKKQLDIATDRRRKDLDDILALTNPAVRSKLLQSYADAADAASVNMKAAALKDQANHVILPLASMKDNEVYAPNYNNGDRVALIRYPHAGPFEIPELTVNNRHPEARSLLGDARDAVAINAKVAERLSGADFDGDTVLVIPNNRGVLKTAPALEGLKKFHPQEDYPPHDGMKTIDGGHYNAATKSVDYGGKLPSSKGKGLQMGLVSNLITDMTIQGASNDELARAVRHSMVVIDAEKHHLNYKLSAERNGIRALTKKYQPKENGRYGGAATLISRAKSQTTVDARRPRPMKKGGPIDRATGKKVYERKPGFVDPKTGETRYARLKSVKLRETDDARTLSSGTKIEEIYATHSNQMKSLGNEARKALVSTPSIRMNPSAKKVYANEVATLNSKLNEAIRNAPKERQAQLYAHVVLQAKRDANPNMDGSQIKKVNAQALAEGRVRYGAKKKLVDITDSEWDAIQAGAISHNKLTQILNNTDIERVKTLATPRPKLLMSGSNLVRAKAMQAAGLTQAEIASALGVSVTTVKEGLK